MGMREDLADHPLLFVLGYASLRRILEFLELGDRILHVRKQHVGHIAAHALTEHDAHHDDKGCAMIWKTM